MRTAGRCFAALLRILHDCGRCKNRLPVSAYEELKKSLADHEYVIEEAPFNVQIVEPPEGAQHDEDRTHAGQGGGGEEIAGSLAEFVDALRTGRVPSGEVHSNVLSLATRPKYDMENTFLHEAVPGHHLQSARAQEIRGLPTFRRNAFYNAYGEGWALYAESLGTALGVYRDPYSRFGALSWEMVRACRLVIDTGIHAFGWKQYER